MEKLEIRKVETGYKFYLKAANGERIAASEVYATLAACRKGAGGMARAAERAKLMDLTREEAGTVSNPRFEVFSDKAGAYRFRLRARNGKIVASSEPYTAKAACEKGVESVKNALWTEPGPGE